jgi:hypothetical protein
MIANNRGNNRGQRAIVSNIRVNFSLTPIVLFGSKIVTSKAGKKKKDKSVVRAETLYQ